MATAVYVAEQSIIGDATFSQVFVYVPNPWGDSPPTQSKELATVYYSGPDPKKGPWPDDPWMIMGTNHRAGTLPDIEFDKLSSEMLGAIYDKIKDPSKIKDPDKISDKADAEAKAIVIRKYHLPRNWQPLDMDDIIVSKINARRNQIHITSMEGVEDSISALHHALMECGTDLLCNGEKFRIEASAPCARAIEQLAKNDFQWFDAWYEPKFDKYKWRDSSAGIITYTGNKIKFENGFGAWIRSTYECDYNLRTATVVGVRASDY